jgi:hypothetical protein
MDNASPKIKGEIGRYAKSSWMRVPDLMEDKNTLSKFFGT